MSVSSDSGEDQSSDQTVADCSTLATATSAAPMEREASPAHATFSDRGARPYQEDAWAHLLLGPGVSAYGVFDGHGGAQVARYCSTHLLSRVAAALAARGAAALAGAPLGAAAHAWALKAAYKAVDAELTRAGGARMCGSTAVAAVVTDNAIYMANCGAFASRLRGCGQ
jgi:serine/threonine protein phosphatase PrpC